MTGWMMVRLEQGRTADAPEGDPGHAYILHVVLDADGFLDEEAIGADPRRATVVRYKPGEADYHGWLTRMSDRSWGISYEPGEEDDEPIFRLDLHKIVEGDYVTIRDHTTGEAQPFRIVSCRPVS